MKKFIIISISAIIFIFSACVPEPLDIDVPEMEQKIVISSQFLADSGVVVSCTRTFSALTDDYMPEKINIDFINKVFGMHSLVLMEHDGFTDTLYHMGLGLYYNDSLKFEPGQSCHLYVYDSIINAASTSEAVYMSSADFDTVTVEIQIKDEDTNAVVYYYVNDLPENNYYLVNNYILRENSGSFDISEFMGNNPYGDLIEEYIEESDYGMIFSRLSSFGSFDYQMEIIKDKDFQSQYIKDSVLFENISLNDTVAISIANISKDYNDYLELRKKAGSIYSQIMSDPINMPTNIENGYGMFTTHSLNIWLIDLSQNAIISKKNF